MDKGEAETPVTIYGFSTVRPAYAAAAALGRGGEWSAE
jgi:hypothetical protein